MSYKAFGLDTLATQKIIFFQEITNPDRDIAKKFGYEAIGDSENIGIAGGYKRLVEHATGDFFLFLENDWVLLEPAKEEIQKGIDILFRGAADVIRYRSRKYPGSPLWTLQFKGSEWEHPTHVLDAVHWTETPENHTGISKGLNDYYYATAENANWTNNPTMFKTDWLKNVVVPRFGTRDVEIDLQEWWEKQSTIMVAQGEGLFTHRRIG
jgi:hypothetical protein